MLIGSALACARTVDGAESTTTTGARPTARRLAALDMHLFAREPVIPCLQVGGPCAVRRCGRVPSTLSSWKRCRDLGTNTPSPPLTDGRALRQQRRLRLANPPSNRRLMEGRELLELLQREGAGVDGCDAVDKLRRLLYDPFLESRPELRRELGRRGSLRGDGGLHGADHEVSHAAGIEHAARRGHACGISWCWTGPWLRLCPDRDGESQDEEQGAVAPVRW